MQRRGTNCSSSQAQSEVDESFYVVVRRAVSRVDRTTSRHDRNVDVSHSSSPATDVQDQNRTFRTRLVLIWILTNVTLAAAIQFQAQRLPDLVEACLDSATINKDCIDKALNVDTGSLVGRQHVYFRYLIWTTFGLSAIRFVGVSPTSSPSLCKAEMRP